MKVFAARRLERAGQRVEETASFRGSSPRAADDAGEGQRAAGADAKSVRARADLDRLGERRGARARVSQEIAGAEGPAPLRTDRVSAAPNEAAELKLTWPELIVVGPV